MLKKLLPLLMIAVFLGLATAGRPALSETAGDCPPPAVAAMTEEELLLFINHMRRLVETEGDKEKIKTVIGATGFADPNRFMYVKTKCSNAMGIIRYGESLRGSLPPQARPTDEEMALVRKYQAEFESLRAGIIKLF